MTIKIIGGRFRSRPLLTLPDKATTRPTLARVRESLFNMLAPMLEEATVCDAFAGSGAFGFEALSRDARRVLFIESDPAAAQLITRNAAALGVLDKCQVMAVPFGAWLQGQAGKLVTEVDVWLLDPPYNFARQGELLALLAAKLSQAHPGASSPVVVYQSGPKEALPKAIEPRLEQYDQRRYGNSMLSFYRLAPPPPPPLAAQAPPLS